MRLASLTGQLLTTLGLTLALSGAAYADGGQRDAPIEPLDRPADEVVVTIERPAPEREEPSKVAVAMGRSLTICEQLRIDLHNTQRDFYARKRDDRRAAFIGIRTGDLEARYICIGTQCTVARQQQLRDRITKWDHKTVELQERINRGPVGASDKCHIWHMSMMDQLMEGARWHRMGRSPKRHGKMMHDGDHRGPQGGGPVDRRDPFEIEMETRLEKARRIRGY